MQAISLRHVYNNIIGGVPSFTFSLKEITVNSIVGVREYKGTFTIV